MFKQSTPGKNAAYAFFLLLGTLGFKLLVELIALAPFFDPTTLTISEIPIYIFFWVTVASVIPLLFFIQHWNQTHNDKISSVQFLNWQKIPALALIGFIVIGLGIIFLNSGLELIWPKSTYASDNSFDSLEHFVIINGWIDGIFKIMTIVIAAAVVEELLFRTFFLTALRDFVGNISAILLSATVFTIIHLHYWSINPLLLFNVFLLAVGLGSVRLLSGSVIPAIVIHALNNGFSLTIINLEQFHPTAWGITELSIDFWFGLGIILVFAGWIILKNEFRKLVLETKNNPTNERKISQ